MRHVSGFVSAQSGDTDKAKKIREAAIFTISFVACDSPFGKQLLWSIFKALHTFGAYQTLSLSFNAFRALIYIESLEFSDRFIFAKQKSLIQLLQPLQPPLPPFPTPPSTLSALEGPLSPLLVDSSDYKISRTLTRMESLWASPFSSMNWGQISLEGEPLATMLPTTAKFEEGREVECCVLEDGYLEFTR
ncbi:hypothetical protein IGI04_013940 [Brassica rapa subsp. trilocularis]|uniref:Uncharacterized protein n=1 Tax=Brassica rapa subsp. trilocularis TaxID=1813537 RepID=A0ABQ7NA80_BRACM|nr:hypothetical protein IGI04_013940 [Brassica rapa subsp. trilocularis]